MDKCREPRIKAIYFEVGGEPEEVLYGRAKRRIRRKKKLKSK